MLTVRTVSGPAYLEMIEEVDRELMKVIEDFDCAMNFETLCLANETSKLSFSQSSAVDPQGFCIEHAEKE